MEPLNVARKDFPECTRTAEGMKILVPECSRYDMEYINDVVYAERDGRKLHLQIILPYKWSEPLPLIVYIPGSAFHRQEVKRSVPNLALLAAKGYAVALLEYRGSEDAIFPSVVVDAKAGIMFMKEHAEKYRVNLDKIIVMGDSSGGYTALMAGLTCQIASLEDEWSFGKDYSVKGIVDFYGPTDFTTMNDEPSTQNHSAPDSPEGLFIGRKVVDPASELVQRTIIKNYVGDGRVLPPVLMFHGSADELVPFSQSCELYDALKQNGHKAALYQVKGAHHGGAEFWSETTLELVDEFIKQVLF